MERVQIYHNPGCSKSRGALEILRERDVELDVIEYLKTPPDRTQLVRILELLPDPPADLVRNDKRFRELELDAESYRDADAVVDLLLKHPELMQRPVVIRGDRAVVGRPSEKALEVF